MLHRASIFPVSPAAILIFPASPSPWQDAPSKPPPCTLLTPRRVWRSVPVLRNATARAPVGAFHRHVFPQQPAQGIGTRASHLFFVGLAFSFADTRTVFVPGIVATQRLLIGFEDVKDVADLPGNRQAAPVPLASKRAGNRRRISITSSCRRRQLCQGPMEAKSSSCHKRISRPGMQAPVGGSQAGLSARLSARA